MSPIVQRYFDYLAHFVTPRDPLRLYSGIPISASVQFAIRTACGGGAQLLAFALATVALSLALGLLAATALTRRPAAPPLPLSPSLLDPLLMLPLGTSAVTLGLGYIVALDRPPLNLRTSPLLVVLAHTLVALPFVLRSILPALRSIHPRLREAAALLGASPWRVWREVDLPIVARAVLVGAVFAFTVSLGSLERRA